MYEFETLADGERVSTRQPDGYFSMMSDFIQGKRQATSYGSAKMSSCATSNSGSQVQEWCTRPGK
jgi:hypothetical protein